MKKYIFPILIAISALSLAGAAAFFSVTGLSKLFGGAKVEVIIMASALELAKLVTASFLHRYWKILKWQMRSFLIVAVITVMMITSAGIYGFLSNAYATTSGKLQNIDAQVELVEQKKIIINSEITRLQENKTMKSDRVSSLIKLRANQESRVDSLYNRKQVVSAKRVEGQIEQASKDITSANIEIDSLNNKIQRKSSETSALNLEIINLKNNDVSSEVGPLKYIAKLTGKDMDYVVNFFILLLIFVFDPLAVCLVVATNISIRAEFGENEKQKKELEQELKDEPKKELKDELKQELKQELKEESVAIQYLTDESGEFKTVETSVVDEEKERVRKIILDDIKSQGIEYNASYLKFLEVLFKGGNIQVGQVLPRYNKFLEEIKAAKIKYVEQEVKDFLTICNLFKITDMSGPEKKISKDYATAKDIVINAF